MPIPPSLEVTKNPGRSQSLGQGFYSDQELFASCEEFHFQHLQRYLHGVDTARITSFG